MTTLNPKHLLILFLLALLFSCTSKKDQQFESELKLINLKQGDIAACGTGEFGNVNFNISCEEKVKSKFNLATALLHSFEYEDAEKVFAKVIEEDPECVMAYWGVAMSNFHALWAMNEKLDLNKGAKAVKLARLLAIKSEREADYVEAIGAFYDNWEKIDHKSRSLKFEKAMEEIYRKYPSEKEAAIFYALALNANADPADKTYSKQKKAGEILSKIYPANPNHPGIAHYIIHTYDYPELALRGLPAARSYAAIAPASAHAQHMPSHIFTRLGFWEESIKSNLNSISAAQCYAANVRMKGHWDEELHGMDYLVYAYLQTGKDSLAREQLKYLNSIIATSKENGKSAYVFAAIPSRFALERKKWQDAAELGFHPANFPWDNFPWEKAMIHFGKLLGYVHTNNLEKANKELEQLKHLQKQLHDAKEVYKANQVQIQVSAGAGWIEFVKGNKEEGIRLMTLAADLEDATGKHPVTPGEVLPARELLGDMFMEMGDAARALKMYEINLKSHPNRFNGLYGAAVAARKLNDTKKADQYYNKLLEVADSGNSERPEIKEATEFVSRKIPLSQKKAVSFGRKK